MAKITKSIFFKPKNKKLADKISIKTPTQFKKSIQELSKKGLTLEEKKALTLARTRAKVQLKRKNLSKREMNQMSAIANTAIPRVTKRKNGRKNKV